MRERLREPEPRDVIDSKYERIQSYVDARLKGAMTGRIVIRDEDTPWEQNRQGHLRYFLYPGRTDTATQDWMVFCHDIATKSGKHRHQGGLVIYVLDGFGYTTINEERVDWKEGDLLLLPIIPEGVTHQHFNTRVEKPSTWLALLYTPWFDALGDEQAQVDESPTFKGYGRAEQR